MVRKKSHLSVAGEDTAEAAVESARTLEAKAATGGFNGSPGRPGDLGPQGPQGLPGVTAIPTDAAIAAYVSTQGESATQKALDARYLTAVTTEHGTNLYLNGVTL